MVGSIGTRAHIPRAHPLHHIGNGGNGAQQHLGQQNNGGNQHHGGNQQNGDHHKLLFVELRPQGRQVLNLVDCPACLLVFHAGHAAIGAGHESMPPHEGQDVAIRYRFPQQCLVSDGQDAAGRVGNQSKKRWVMGIFAVDQVRKKRFLHAHDNHGIMLVNLMEIERCVGHMKHGNPFKLRVHRVADGKIGCMGIAHHLPIQDGGIQFVNERRIPPRIEEAIIENPCPILIDDGNSADIRLGECGDAQLFCQFGDVLRVIRFICQGIDQVGYISIRVNLIENIIIEGHGNVQ